MKKKDLPAMPFYWGDWFKALDVQMLPRDIRCTWFEMIGRMWESSERGELSFNGMAPSIEQLAQLLGFGSDIKECQRHINFLERFSLFSRRKNGVIYNRKMVKNEEISRKRSNSGKLGMENRYNKSDNKQGNKSLTNAENESENEIECVIDLLNKNTGSNFKTKTEPTRKAIRARLNDGFTLDDFKTVIEKKSKEWKGTEWEKYLNPDTLFRPSNFEKYLNQKINEKGSENARPTNKTFAQIDGDETLRILTDGQDRLRRIRAMRAGNDNRNGVNPSLQLTGENARVRVSSNQSGNFNGGIG